MAVLSKFDELIRLLEDVSTRNKYKASTDKYKSELQKTYEDWYKELAGDLSKEESEAKRGRLTDAALLLLLMELKRLGRERLEEAYMQSIEAVDITPEMVDEMELIIASNDDYLTDSLIPALDERIEKNVTPEIWFAGLAAILGTFTGFSARVGLYAGAYWNAIWKGATQEHRIQNREEWQCLWLLDPRSQHCSDCLRFAGAYVNYYVMLTMTGGLEPGSGELECSGNCRCDLLTRSGPEMEWVVMGSGGVTESMRTRQSMQLTFYKLTSVGQRKDATVTWDGKEVTHSGATEALLRSLFRDRVEDLSPGDICQAMRDAPRRFDGAYVQAELTEGIEEGGPGSGHHGHSGRPGARGGSMSGASAKKIRLTRHAFNRTKERTGFGPVRRALKALSRMEVPEKEWHTELYRSRGQLAGYMQGFDGRVKTVLGAWYKKGKLSGEEITWQR